VVAMNYWVEYLKVFFEGIAETYIDYHENGFEYLRTSEILSLGITITSRHGFLGIKFPNSTLKKKFMSFSIMDKESNIHGNFTITETVWDSSQYPCRVYINNTRIHFYDKNNHLLEKEKIEKREIVLQSVFNSLIELKQYVSKSKISGKMN
tara:strand:- start:173 stop:625 length:453 start_codon:yes stop_codon:yes gene_type:complete